MEDQKFAGGDQNLKDSLFETNWAFCVEPTWDKDI